MKIESKTPLAINNKVTKKQLSDVLFLDMNLLRKNGDQVLSKIQNAPLTNAFPVVALSVNAMAADIEYSKNISFIDFITKPNDICYFYQLMNKF